MMRDRCPRSVIREKNHYTIHIMKKLLLYAMTVAVLSGCSSNNDNENNEVVNMLPETRGIELTQEQREFVNKNTDFSFNLFRTISQMPAGQKGSIVSPISVIYMMGMLNTSAGPFDPPMNVDFHANHPFVYVIQEASSGAVFFIGSYRGN